MKAKGLNFLASVSSSSLFMSVRMVRLSISSVLIMRSHKISFSVLSKYVVCPKLLRTKTDYSSNIACSQSPCSEMYFWSWALSDHQASRYVLNCITTYFFYTIAAWCNPPNRIAFSLACIQRILCVISLSLHAKIIWTSIATTLSSWVLPEYFLFLRLMRKTGIRS